MKNIHINIYVLIITFLLGFTCDSFASTLRIDKGRHRVELSPGETHSYEVQVTNPTDRDSTLNIYLQDWQYLPKGDGEKDYFPPGTLSDSAAGWIRYNPEDAVIPAHGTQMITFNVSVPEEAGPGTHYALAFFETAIGTSQDSDGSVINVSGRLGSLIYIDIEGTVDSSGSIDDISIQPGSGNKPSLIDVTFSNNGNTLIVLQGEFIVFDAGGRVKGRGNTIPIYTRGGMTATRQTEWTHRLKPGEYEIVFTFDLGNDQLLVEDRAFVVE